MGSGGRDPKGRFVGSGDTLRSTWRTMGGAYCGLWNTLRGTFWVWGASRGAHVKCGGNPSGIQRVTLGEGHAVGLEGIPRNTLWGEGCLEGPLCGVWAPQGAHCKREELIALAELRAQQESDLSRERVTAGRTRCWG